MKFDFKDKRVSIKRIVLAAIPLALAVLIGLELWFEGPHVSTRRLPTKILSWRDGLFGVPRPARFVFDGFFPSISFGKEHEEQAVAVAVALVVFLAHFYLLFRIKRLTTQTGRWIVLLLPLVAGVAAAFVVALSGQIAPAFGILLSLPVILLIAVALPFWTYSIPCTFVSALPLLAVYMFFPLVGYYALGFGLIPPIAVFLSGWLFPRHRRLVEYWRPARLPRLRRSQAGFTLIELLIDIAIVAIFAAAIAHVTSITRRSLEQQETWRQAVALAEDEIALLRARDALPEPGVHPVEPELKETYSFAGQAEVDIRPGPTPALREARVTVRLRGDGSRRDVSLAALIPVPSQKRITQ